MSLQVSLLCRSWENKTSTLHHDDAAEWIPSFPSYQFSHVSKPFLPWQHTVATTSFSEGTITLILQTSPFFRGWNGWRNETTLLDKILHWKRCSPDFINSPFPNNKNHPESAAHGSVSLEVSAKVSSWRSWELQEKCHWFWWICDGMIANLHSGKLT